jgi:hypothetical protein
LTLLFLISIFGAETSFDFAAQLKRAQVPFIFASGYGENANVGHLNESVRAVSKPDDLDDLASAVTRTLERGLPS